MNIGQLKEYIRVNNLPDDMEIKLDIEYNEYIPDLVIKENKLLIS